MSVYSSKIFPDVMLDSQELTQAFMEGNLTSEMIRSEPRLVQAMRKGEISKEWMNTLNGLPFYCAHSADPEDEKASTFDKHFNPSLKHDSEYFGKLNEMIACVEKNAKEATTPE